MRKLTGTIAAALLALAASLTLHLLNAGDTVTYLALALVAALGLPLITALTSDISTSPRRDTPAATRH
ncbi:hypothetical protein GKE82_23450 [Conexibacter sp. W3-3-2]|uniref:hypothetical protein n=1 Tax=Conexibacter sp. W3-3-2 TaxID=2675227 RepID=UPI0012B7EB98|nr:hypothetical protein [Conexibacter sp. W3-3-2]MTD47161.1 hypothetical protein [Conexibacter sp. W3-3-2]